MCSIQTASLREAGALLHASSHPHECYSKGMAIIVHVVLSRSPGAVSWLWVTTWSSEGGLVAAVWVE